MPNKNYNKGRRKEYSIVNKEREQGCIAVRTAGSHGPFDVVSIDVHNRLIKLIQSKPVSMGRTEILKLYEANIDLSGHYEVIFEVR